eukprot:scaffold1307_cov166-Ochromonas_danica.AAC.40
MDEDMRHLDALYHYQDSMRKLKPVWKKKEQDSKKTTSTSATSTTTTTTTPSSSSHIVPFSEEVLNDHSYRFAKLVQGLDDVLDPPMFCSSTEAIGIEIPFDHSSAADYCWTTFGFLHDFIWCGYFNPFPKPIHTQRQDKSLTTIFTFEHASTKPLTRFLGVDLGRQLRKLPSIASLWAIQLSLAVQALARCQGQMIHTLAIDKDILVRDDGMLLISRMTFLELDVEVFQEDLVESEAESVLSRNRNLSLFTETIYRLFSTVFSISRQEKFVLPQVNSFFTAGSAFTRSEEVFGEESIYSGQAQQHILAVQSQLTIEVDGGAIVDTVLLPFKDAYEPLSDGGLKRSIDSQPRYSTLIVVSAWYPAPATRGGANQSKADPKVLVKVIKIDKEEIGEVSRVLIDVCGEAAGTLVLELSCIMPNSYDLAVSERRLGSVEVTITEMPPTQSVELQELLGYVEDGYVWKMPSAIYQSQLFQKARELLDDSEKSKELMIQCAKDWNNVKRIIVSGMLRSIHLKCDKGTAFLQSNCALADYYGAELYTPPSLLPPSQKKRET